MNQLPHIEALATRIAAVLGERVRREPALPEDLIVATDSASLLEVARTLRDHPQLRFEILIDLCGVDYLEFGRSEWKTMSASGSGFSRGVNRGAAQIESREAESHHGQLRDRRFFVVYQLLSVTLNQRLTLRVACEWASAHSDDDPAIDSVCEIWASANWLEREAFDLFGILFRNHPDLRRILTDYGFIGHPFRKDFPLIGNVEVRYDPQKQRVVYEPVSIEPRVLVPKVIRHDNRYAPALRDGKPSSPPVGGPNG